MWSVEIILVGGLNHPDCVDQLPVCAWGVWVSFFSSWGKFIFSRCGLAILRVFSWSNWGSCEWHEWLIRFLNEAHQRWQSLFEQSISFNFSRMNLEDGWYFVGVVGWYNNRLLSQLSQWGERWERCWAWCKCLNWLLHVAAALQVVRLHHLVLHHVEVHVHGWFSHLLWSLRSELFLILALLDVVDAWNIWCIALIDLLESEI